jgi:hypothetical protein
MLKAGRMGSSAVRRGFASLKCIPYAQ